MKEHRLDDMELGSAQAREALQCLLHSILFCRAPGPFRPQTVHLEARATLLSSRARRRRAAERVVAARARSRRAQHFHLSFARCSNHSIARAVDSAVDSLMATLTPAGPELLKVRARVRAPLSLIHI